MVFLYYKRFFLFQEYPKDVALIATFKNNKYKKVTTTIKLTIPNKRTKFWNEILMPHEIPIHLFEPSGL